MVLCKVAHFCLQQFLSVTSMLSQLNWLSLEEIRTNMIITMFYKVISQQSDLYTDFSHDL